MKPSHVHFVIWAIGMVCIIPVEYLFYHLKGEAYYYLVSVVVLVFMYQIIDIVYGLWKRHYDNHAQRNQPDRLEQKG